MSLQIENPDWLKMLKGDVSFDVHVKNLAEWFQENVEPINKMLSEGVEVGRHPNLGLQWDEGLSIEHCKEKALLINIQPIKEETAEEILSNMYNNFKRTGYYLDRDTEKMKKFMERKKCPKKS